MAKLSFDVVDIPKTTSGRTPAPNPYTEHMTHLLGLPTGKAMKFQPLGDDTDKFVVRKLRSAAPENITVRTKFDAETNTLTVWTAAKVKSNPRTTPEGIAAAKAKADAAAAAAEGTAKTAPKTDAK